MMAKTLQDFVNTYNLDDDLIEWLDGRITNLSEQAFLDSLRGKNGKALAVNPFEKFWISISGHYVPDESDPPAPDNKYDMVLGSVLLPTEIFIEGSQEHKCVFLDESEVITLSSSQGFFLKKETQYKELGTPISTPFDITAQKGKNTIRPFNLRAGDRLYIPAGSLLTFAWKDKPTKEVLTTLTLVAKKKHEPNSDTAIVKLSGRFTIWDSREGWIRDSSGYPHILDISQFAVFSDERLFDDAFISNYLFTDYSIATTGTYDTVFNRFGTVVIKNESKYARTLKLIPYKQEGEPTPYDGEIDNYDLPPNVEYAGGALEITLEANQG